jgi:hypothetical protein
MSAGANMSASAQLWDRQGVERRSPYHAPIYSMHSAFKNCIPKTTLSHGLLVMIPYMIPGRYKGHHAARSVPHTIFKILCMSGFYKVPRQLFMHNANISNFNNFYDWV